MEWISVEDELPASCEEVLIWPRPEVNDGEIFTGCYYHHSESFYVWSGSDGEWMVANVTHWSPLPSGP